MIHNYGLHILETKLADLIAEREKVECRVGNGYFTGSACIYNSEEYLGFDRLVDRIDEIKRAITILKDGLEGQQQEI